jgi:hypothetical protein
VCVCVCAAVCFIILLILTTASVRPLKRLQSAFSPRIVLRADVRYGEKAKPCTHRAQI